MKHVLGDTFEIYPLTRLAALGDVSALISEATKQNVPPRVLVDYNLNKYPNNNRELTGADIISLLDKRKFPMRNIGLISGDETNNSKILRLTQNYGNRDDTLPNNAIAFSDKGRLSQKNIEIDNKVHAINEYPNKFRGFVKALGMPSDVQQFLLDLTKGVYNIPRFPNKPKKSKNAQKAYERMLGGKPPSKWEDSIAIELKDGGILQKLTSNQQLFVDEYIEFMKKNKYRH